MWSERDGEQADFVKADIHSISGTGKSVSVMPKGAERESGWIFRQDWAKELRRRQEGEEKPKAPKCRDRDKDQAATDKAQDTQRGADSARRDGEQPPPERQ